MFSFEKRIHQGLFFLFLFFLACGTNARASDSQVANPEIKIEDISILLTDQEAKKAEKDKEGNFTLQVGINDKLRLQIRNLKSLKEKKDQCSEQPSCNRKIALYLNGMKISEASTINLEEGKVDGTIDFDLKYDPKNSEIKQNWLSILGAPIPNFDKDKKNIPPKHDFLTRPVNIAIGLNDGSKWIPFENKIIDKDNKEKDFFVMIEQEYLIKIENISISLMGQEDKKAEENKKGNFFELQVGINDRLRLQVRNLKALIEAKDQCPAQSICKRNIVLYLNGMEISEASTINLEEGKSDGTIEFILKYDSKNPEIKQNWASLLGAPIPGFGGKESDPPKPGFFTRPVNIAIGLDDGSKWIPFEDKIKREKETKAFYVVLEQVNPIKFWIFIIFLTIIFISICVYRPLQGALKAALSDIGPGPKPESGTKPWSLARCQMAFWLVLVTVSFVSIWVTTGALDGISESALALIGIGTGAALGSVAIDISGDSQAKKKDLQQKLIEMQDETQSIERELQQNQENQASTPDQKYKKRLLDALLYNKEQIQEKIQRISGNNPSQGFWKDILSDPDGNAALHRIQIVIWTLILGIIYVYSVWENLAMPEFSPTLLALQGLSAGAYLGFKIPDKKS